MTIMSLTLSMTKSLKKKMSPSNILMSLLSLNPKAENLSITKKGFLRTSVKMKTMRRKTQMRWFLRDHKNRLLNRARMTVRKFIPNYPNFAKTQILSKSSLNLIQPTTGTIYRVISLFPHPLSQTSSITRSSVSNGSTTSGTAARVASSETTWASAKLSKLPLSSKVSSMPK